MGLNLAKRVFDIAPDWLRVRIFELSDEEKFFLEVLKDKRNKIRGYICSDEPERRDVMECSHMMRTMKFLLDRYGKDGRFYNYFFEKARRLGEDFKCLLRYR